MKIQTKILVLALSLASLPVIALTVLMLQNYLTQQHQDLLAASRGCAAMLAQELVSGLASGRVDRLDLRLSHMVDHGIGMMDVRMVGVLDHENRVMAHSDHGLYGKVIHDSGIQEAMQTKTAILQETHEGAEHYLRVYQPMITAPDGQDGLFWGTILLDIDLRNLHSQGVRAVFKALVLVIPGLGLLLLFAYVSLTQILIRPLLRITQTAACYAQGDLSHRVTIHTKDELASLGNTMNDMAERLHDQTRRLEEGIAERTKELETANQSLNHALRQLSEANEALSTLATTDGLTGLRNFRAFQHGLRVQLQSSRRLGTEATLLMLDLDKFKQYNDRNGHPEGDKLLVAIADTIKKRIRETDMACRYGGDEFAVLLANTPKEAGLHLAEELRRLIGEQAFLDRVETLVHMGISVGVATFPGDAEDAPSLILAADNALYGAKEQGRNRVVDAATI